MGREEWYSFPKDERTQQLLKEKGIKDLPVKLKVGQELGGHKGFGYMHLLSHAKDFAKIGESPLLYLYNTMNKLSTIREENRRGRYRLRTEDEVQYEKGYNRERR
ncbi:MAG: hypothetical protein Q4C05_05450 [Akkermansia sp.]|nr:hypothetical protein [Akkermansia sp.]